MALQQFIMWLKLYDTIFLTMHICKYAFHFACLFCVGNWHAVLAVVYSCKEMHKELQLCMLCYKWQVLMHMFACRALRLLSACCALHLGPTCFWVHACRSSSAGKQWASCGLFFICPPSSAKSSYFCSIWSRTDTICTINMELWKMVQSGSTSFPLTTQHRWTNWACD